MYRRPTPANRKPIPVVAAFLLLATSLGAGCAGHRPPQDTTQPPIPGYESLQESFAGLDLTPLHGRRLVLDPGHGGYFRGALGPNGLAEADVNLGVALYLRGLLEWAGAQVWLTRSADTDFLTPADSTLASDLHMRVSLSDSLQPDVFISIHHNSTANRDTTINATQTYYPLNDDGASLDMARAIHRHLVLNLEITPASIRPGNFHVLRNATVPAVLGEPAMISHPVMAGRLSLAASQKLEAQAYFLGLLDYFAGGLPVWSGARTDTVYWGGADDQQSLTWHFLPDGNHELSPEATPPGPDPARTRLTLDGHPIPLRLSPDARTVTWDLPADLPLAPHVLRIQGRNLAGRATPARRTILLPREGRVVAVTVTLALGSGLGAVHWFAPGGGPLPPGQLQLGPELAFQVGPSLPTWQVVPNLDVRWPDQQATFVSAEEAAASLPCPVEVSRLPAAADLRLVMAGPDPFCPTDGWRPRLGMSGSTTPLITLEATGPYWLEGHGVLPLVGTTARDFDGPGSVPSPATLPATPLLPGLMGRVIVLDPAGGDTDTDGAGPLGLRGADLNLAVAQQAAVLLRGAGAEVHFTRTDETALPPVEKVRLAGRVSADLFLTIGRHQPDTPRVIRYHPGSITGRLWARAARRATALLPLPDSANAPDSCLITEANSYLLRHTACPALEWRLDPPATAEAELRQLQPGWQQAEARAILLATAAITGHPTVFEYQLQPAELLPLLARQGGLPTASVDWVQLDGNLPWAPLPPGPGSDQTVDSGNGPGLPVEGPRHLLEIHAGERWQLWSLTSDQAGWQATRLLGNEPIPPR